MSGIRRIIAIGMTVLSGIAIYCFYSLKYPLNKYRNTKNIVNNKNTNNMELYYHKTDGGAEYYSTKPNDLSTTVLRTDGNELEISNFEQLKKAGFESVVFNGEKYKL